MKIDINNVDNNRSFSDLAGDVFSQILCESMKLECKSVDITIYPSEDLTAVYYERIFPESLDNSPVFNEVTCSHLGRSLIIDMVCHNLPFSIYGVEKIEVGGQKYGTIDNGKVLILSNSRFSISDSDMARKEYTDSVKAFFVHFVKSKELPIDEFRVFEPIIKYINEEHKQDIGINGELWIRQGFQYMFDMLYKKDFRGNSFIVQFKGSIPAKVVRQISDFLEELPESEHYSSNALRKRYFHQTEHVFTCLSDFSVIMQNVIEEVEWGWIPEEIKARAELRIFELWHPNIYKRETLILALDHFNIPIERLDTTSSASICKALEMFRIPSVPELALLEEIMPPEEIILSPEEQKYHKQVQEWKATGISNIGHKDINPTEYDILQSNIEYYMHIPGGLGSNGIFVVEASGGSRLVVKEAANYIGELYSVYIGNVLNDSNQWIIPQVKLLEKGSSEFKIIVERLQYLSEIRNQGLGTDTSRIARMGQNENFMLMTFVNNSFTLLDIPEEIDLGDLFTCNILRNIGRALFYDLLINNWDRLPLDGIWDNEGNPSNLMFKYIDNQYHIVLIDQSITVILEEHAINYYIKVKNKIIQLSESSEGLNSIREMIKNITTHDIGDVGVTNLHEGFMQCFESLRRSQAFSKQNMTSISNKILEEIPITGRLALNRKEELRYNLNDIEDFLTNLITTIE